MNISSNMLSVIGLLVVLAPCAWGDEPTLPQPVEGASIISDFGPRKYPKSPWHKGIDLAAPRGTPIRAVEVSTITNIAFQAKGGGWYMETRSASGNRIWEYLHMFTNGTTAMTTFYSTHTVGNFVLLKSTSTTDKFIVLLDPQTKRPVKGFTNRDRLAGQMFQFSKAGSTVSFSVPLTNILDAGDALGPVGISGSAKGYHLDVRVKMDNIVRNPLFYIQHTASNYTITPQYPREGVVLRNADLSVRMDTGGIVTDTLIRHPITFKIDSKRI